MTDREKSMEVILAGYNLDAETIDQARNYLRQLPEKLANDAFRDEVSAFVERDNFTPETLSAAYARISRNPAPVPELRQIARHEVDKARRSNTNIIFGLGHSSVAEHAVFNFDILGVSRRLVEEIQQFRLTSFTEKSQRYILLTDDHVVPEEIRGSKYELQFRQIINRQNQGYRDLYEKLRPHIFAKYHELAKDKKNHKMLEGWAKEDARYIVSLATEAQMGMTVNARTLEYMVAKLASHPLAEARQFAAKAHAAVAAMSPSIVKYTEPTPFFRDMPDEIAAAITIMQNNIEAEKDEQSEAVNLLNFTPAGDDAVLEALLFEFGGIDLFRARQYVAGIDNAEKAEILKILFRHLAPFQIPPRAFERAEAEFELILSASCYGQFKRHRMCTQIPGPYDPKLGNTIPATIREVGMADYFMDIVTQTNILHAKIKEEVPLAASYILTNSHRRRLYFKANLRELYHVSRLREDQHAQWDIRELSRQITTELRQVWPLTAVLMAGKDSFARKRREFLGEEEEYE
jgi:flavin-dependent thymidylate synthase